ncbi:MAG: cereblon family protein [Thermodesulfobacteriota bacterium]
MSLAADATVLRLKGSPERFSDELSDPGIDLRRKREIASQKEPIRCAACREPVTEERYRIAVHDSHVHVFTNPYGIVFEIGCFELTTGCRLVGPPSDEFTWFPGFSWQIAVCSGCETHLGWRFLSDVRVFWALVLDRLA